MIKTLTGDLLKDDVDAIVNTVNCVGIMGKGIALQFKKKWPKNFKSYEKAYKHGELSVGKMFVYDSGGLVNPNFIINFPTKKHWKEKTKLSYIEDGLIDLIKQIQLLNIKSIAIPPLGCGNGGLKWDEVKPLILGAFEKLPNIDVHIYEPKGAPDPKTMINNTEKPRMTPGRAAIIKLLSIYRELNYALSNLEIQKLAYFLEQTGQELNLKYVKDQYGPYSNALRHVLTKMDGHYIEGVGDHTAEAQLAPTANALSEAEKFIEESKDVQFKSNLERVSGLICGFETPYGMELLSTVHWVAMNEPDVDSAVKAVAAIHNWNDRKKKLFSEDHISIAWKHLIQHKWIKI